MAEAPLCCFLAGNLAVSWLYHAVHQRCQQGAVSPCVSLDRSVWLPQQELPSTTVRTAAQLGL